MKNKSNQLDALFDVVFDAAEPILFDCDVESCEIDEREAFDGSPALFITFVYGPASKELSVDESMGLLSIVRSALLDAGEQRFPYLRHRHGNSERMI
jgi:hypothetical protein